MVKIICHIEYERRARNRHFKVSRAYYIDPAVDFSFPGMPVIVHKKSCRSRRETVGRGVSKMLNTIYD